jgi:hypothetical protein
VFKTSFRLFSCLVLTALGAWAEDPVGSAQTGQAPRLADAAQYVKHTDADRRSAAAPAAIPSTWYNISTRAAAQSAYLNDYVPTNNIATGWNGSVATGTPG